MLPLSSELQLSSGLFAGANLHPLSVCAIQSLYSVNPSLLLAHSVQYGNGSGVINRFCHSEM